MSPIDKARALLEYREMLGKEGTWADVEEKVGISETMRKRFVALLKLPEKIQQQIVAKNTSTMNITEKHARALLKLNKHPKEQSELFDKMNEGSGVSSEEAMRIAKKIIGESSKKVFKLQYSNTAELIAELEKKLEQLKTEQLTV